MDLFTVLAAAHATGITVDLLKAATTYQQKVKDKKHQQLREMWRVGHLRYGHERNRITQLLIAFYQASLSSNQDVLGLWYSIPEHGPRVLPLITRESYLSGEGAHFQAVGRYVSASLQGSSVDTDDLIEQLATWAALDMKIWDDPLYSLHRITAGGQMDFLLTRFVFYRATYGSLVDELALAVGKQSIEKVQRDTNALLPRRANLLPSVEALLSFEERIVAGGPAVLFAVRLSDKDLGILVKRRSYQVSDELGALTVVPKAFHQPMIDPAAEAALEKTVYRECYEELFGGEEQRGYVDPEFYLARCEAVKELLDPQVATLKSIGLVWDLSRGNYHPLYCLFVRSKDWWRRHHSAIRLNWEIDPELRPLVPLADLSAVGALVYRENWAPESYVALVEGLRWLATETETSELLGSVRPLLPHLNLVPLSSITLTSASNQSS